jgi:hypothetical protein
MSDGEEEATVEKSTDELLSETDELLSDLEGGSSSGGGSDVSLDELESSGGASREAESGASRSTDASSAADSATRASRDGRGVRKYFEPSSAGVAGVLVLAGALVGGMVPIPFVGALTKFLGVGGATFLHGAFASDSRYAETLVASGVVGLALAVFANPVLTVTGIGVPIVAISTAVTVATALVGHYFGRDLRDGLTRDVGGDGGGGGSGSGGGGDVPEW